MLNNKGFAITTILYGILILFIMLVLAMLGILDNYKNNLSKLVEKGSEIINIEPIPPSDYDFKPEKRETKKVPIGVEQTFTALKTGTYKLEVWGAQGGGDCGGYGGYSVGNVSLTQGDVLYIYVGGQGSTCKGDDKADNDTKAENAGGWNGGGSAGLYKDGNVTSWGTGGGGATHIAKVSGLLSKLSNKSDILIVAGGGGGSLCAETCILEGGSGGGMKGSAGNYFKSNYKTNLPTGGTQSSGGKRAGSSNRDGKFGTAARFNRTYNDYSNNGYGGGGGGGYFGGAAGYGQTGAGGSGYIGNSILSSKYMYCYNCTTSSDTSTLTYTTSNVSATATSEYAKKGNGHARITYIGK